MIMKELTLSAHNGLHLRPAKVLAQAAQQFECDIQVEYEGRIAEGKSILSLLQLGVPGMSRIRIYADGGDEQEAIQHFTMLIDSLK